ncbi:MAG TPA: hypothetical protein VF898_04985 [Chloroflexota bacterium]
MPAPSTPSQPTGKPATVVFKTRPTIWWSGLYVVVIIACLAGGMFVTHQFMTYGSLTPSISGDWYGPFYASQGNGASFVNTYNLYVKFTLGNGNQISATTSSCSAANASPYTQPPMIGMGFAGTLNGGRFTMKPQMTTHPGDIESDLAWDGSYHTDTVHIDFYVNGTPHPGSPYASLKRGGYDDFLRTCKVKR